MYEMQRCSALIVGNRIWKGKDLVELINFFFFNTGNYKEMSCVFPEELPLFSCYRVSYTLFPKYAFLLKDSN